MPNLREIKPEGPPGSLVQVNVTYGDQGERTLIYQTHKDRVEGMCQAVVGCSEACAMTAQEIVTMATAIIDELDRRYAGSEGEDDA